MQECIIQAQLCNLHSWFNFCFKRYDVYLWYIYLFSEIYTVDRHIMYLLKAMDKSANNYWMYVTVWQCVSLCGILNILLVSHWNVSTLFFIDCSNDMFLKLYKLDKLLKCNNVDLFWWLFKILNCFLNFWMKQKLIHTISHSLLPLYIVTRKITT